MFVCQLYVQTFNGFKHKIYLQTVGIRNSFEIVELNFIYIFQVNHHLVLEICPEEIHVEGPFTCEHFKFLSKSCTIVPGNFWQKFVLDNYFPGTCKHLAIFCKNM